MILSPTDFVFPWLPLLFLTHTLNLVCSDNSGLFVTVVSVMLRFFLRYRNNGKPLFAMGLQNNCYGVAVFWEIGGGGSLERCGSPDAV